MHHRRHTASVVVVMLTALALLAAITSCSSSADTSAAGGDPATTGTPTTVAAADVPAAPSSGCSAAAVAPGDTQLDLAAGTEAAWYLRHVPTSYSPTVPMPLVLDLHGYSEGAKIHVLQTQLGAFGDTHGFITLTPQVERTPARWDTTLGNSDMAFLGSVLDQAEATLCIDQNRVFVTGLSNGAFMTSAMACQFADRIAAAAPVAGIRDIDGCDPSRPVPVSRSTAPPTRSSRTTGGLGSAAANLPAPDGSGKTLGEVGAVDPADQGARRPHHHRRLGPAQRVRDHLDRVARHRRRHPPHLALPAGRRGRAVPHCRRRPFLAGVEVLRIHRVRRRQDHLHHRCERAHLGLLRGPSSPPELSAQHPILRFRRLRPTDVARCGGPDPAPRRRWESTSTPASS